MPEQDPQKKQDAQVGGSTPTTAESEAAAAGAPVADAPVADQESVKAAQEQFAEDQKYKTENANQPLVRGANDKVGGESF